MGLVHLPAVAGEYPLQEKNMAGEAVYYRRHLFHVGQDLILTGRLRLEGIAIPVVEKADNKLSVNTRKSRKYRIQLIQGRATDGFI